MKGNPFPFACSVFIPGLFLFLAGLLHAQKEILSEAIQKNRVIPSHYRSLDFGSEETFRIVQFTDLHLKTENRKETQNTLRLMEQVLDTTKPDLVVFTGDLVVSEPLKAGWKKMLVPVRERNLPWAATLGNHDGEHDLTPTALMDWLISLPGNINAMNERDMPGAGNSVVILRDTEKEEPLAALWFFDTHSTYHLPGISKYEWVGLEQICWYRETSRVLTEACGGKPLPSLAFIHIPLPEYLHIPETGNMTGTHGENITPPELNSGLFTQMVVSGDVIGVFAGHDHNNDFAGIFKEICLAYGRVTGYSAYGRLERGARVIDLYRRQYRFDTYIYTPEGREQDFSYPPYITKIAGSGYLAAVNPEQEPQKGLSYRYYEGRYRSIEDIENNHLVSSGVTGNITLDPARRKDHFALIFEGWIHIPNTGVYRFSLVSDDGSVLYLDNQVVVENDGLHSTQLKTGQVGLEKGFHRFRLMYFEDHMGQELQLRYASPFSPEGPVSSGMLFH